MATFTVTRNVLLLAHDQNLIDDKEFVLPYDINTRNNLEFPYWNYPSFNLEKSLKYLNKHFSNFVFKSIF